jgi:hypothetical protein
MLITPSREIRTVTPRRPKNGAVGTREQLTPGEVDKPIEAARGNRHGHRDATMILMTYRHGLRAAALIQPRISILAVRLRNTKSSTLRPRCDCRRAIRHLGARAHSDGERGPAAGKP